MATLYTVTGRSAVLGSGMLLALSPEQANPRSLNLKDEGDGKYLVVSPIEFKRGETVVVLEGAVPKTVLSNLSADEEEETPPHSAPDEGAEDTTDDEREPSGETSGR